MKRVLLLETVRPERLRHHRAERFPFLVGLLQDLRLEVRWWVCPEAEGGERFVATPAPEVLGALSERLARWQPDVIVTNNRPDEALAALCRQATAGGRLVDLDGQDGLYAFTPVDEVGALLFGDTPPPGWKASQLALADAARPVFLREPIVPLPEELRDQPARLLGREIVCNYRRSLRGNPHFAALAEADLAGAVGCSFCGNHLQDARPLADRLALSPLELTIRQIEAHQTSETEQRARYAYLVEDVGFHGRLAESLSELVARVRRPTTIYTMLRADTICREGPRLEHVLAMMEAGGHALRLLSTGAENFSPRENERFNKGVAIDTLWECHEVLQRLTDRFPDSFGCEEEGFFVGILFTPWTEPEDLRRNAEAARRLGPAWLSRMLGSRLQLRVGSPIAALAARDGLTCTEAGDTGDLVATCLSNAEDEEVPWRFRDPTTRILARLLVRLELSGTQSRIRPTETLYQEIQGRLGTLPARLAEDRVALVHAILDASDALGAEQDELTILDHVREEATADPRWHHEARRAPWMLWLRAVLGADVIPEARLRGYTLTEDQAHAKPDEALMRFAAQRGERVFRFRAREAPGTPGAWLSGDRFTLEHDEATPPVSNEETAVARFVLRILEKRAPFTGDEGEPAGR